MATKTARNQRLYAGATVAVPISRGHGFKLSMPPDMLEDTEFGATFKTYRPGLSDFKVTLNKWYDDAAYVLEDAARNRTLLKFYSYADFAASGDYWAWEGYVALSDQGGAIGAMLDETYEITASSVVTRIHP